MSEFTKFQGTWQLFEMELWNADYFNMEVQAFVEIDSKGGGEFQFEPVCGDFDIDEIGGDRLTEVRKLFLKMGAKDSDISTEKFKEGEIYLLRNM